MPAAVRADGEAGLERSEAGPGEIEREHRQDEGAEAVDEHAAVDDPCRTRKRSQLAREGQGLRSLTSTEVLYGSSRMPKKADVGACALIAAAVWLLYCASAIARRPDG